jgi:hypothetical protein
MSGTFPEFDGVVERLEKLQDRLLAAETGDVKSTAELLRQRGEAIHTFEQLAGGHTCSVEQLARLMKIHSEGQLLWARLSGSRQATLKELASLARDTQLVSSLLAGVRRPSNVNCVG